MEKFLLSSSHWGDSWSSAAYPSLSHGDSGELHQNPALSLFGLQFKQSSFHGQEQISETLRKMDTDYNKGDSFSQFRFAEEKEWDTEVSSPKQISALFVDCESLVQALQELPLSLRLNVAAELVQTTAPLELPQLKPKKMEDGKGLGMQMRWPLGPGSDVISDAASHPVLPGKDGPRPGSSEAFQKITPPLQQTVDHLDEEFDLLLNLDAPVKEEDNTLTAQTYQGPKTKKDGKMVQEENVPEKLSVTEEKSLESEQPPCTSKNVTEEELEDWLDSMIS
uniref:Cell death regulator Aven isoform X1 n=1 Tax=Phascolarctos cinereus TaxID=38626 RepID=A0A6P5L186_PHACI|nr:cell death regulator Aven isoform X1 [Phascolarctos cinereus]